MPALAAPWAHAQARSTRCSSSHLHWDHIENIDLFRHAEILRPQRREYEYAAAIRPADWGTPPYAREMLEGMRVTLLEDREQELFAGVSTLLLPGHSVGLQGLAGRNRTGWRSRARERRAVVGAGDSAARPSGCRLLRSRTRRSASLTRALAAGHIYYPGHDRPFRIEHGRVRYLTSSRYQLRFSFQPDGHDVSTTFSTAASTDIAAPEPQT